MLDKREQKKQTILDVAQKIFSHFGLNKTTMNEIAKATRMGKATLYYYFSSKEQVFNEVIKRESKMLTDKLNASIEEITDPKEKLKIYIITRINSLSTLANTYKALTDEYLEHYSSIKKFRQDFSDLENKIIAGILKEGVDQNIFSKMNIKEIAKVLGLTLRGIEFLIITDEKDEFSNERLNLMMGILLNGICK